MILNYKKIKKSCKRQAASSKLQAA